MSALFLYRRPVLAKLAAKAGERAGLEVACQPVDDYDGGGGYQMVIAPLEDLGVLSERGISGEVRLVLYARQAHERAAELPPEATPLELPFRVDELADVLNEAAGSSPAKAPMSPAGPDSSSSQLSQPSETYKILAVDDDLFYRRLYIAKAIA